MALAENSKGHLFLSQGHLKIERRQSDRLPKSSDSQGITSYLKSFQQMNWINFFLLPMFLFSGSFYPLSVYPSWIQTVIQALPLWQAIDLVRGLTLGVLNWAMLGHVLYFVVMIVVGLWFTTKRLTALFMR